ncbi:MAG: hypothetical protein C4576_10195 [Desulfobacteraceae bacterium]|nr:MAG: hypothetical protein C4576_10195 [Desulfobacteraceae bacterium]
MSGPFSLKYLHLFVRDKSPGAFILSRNGRLADFVGMSSDDVATAIRHHARHAGYRYFWFTSVDTPEEADVLGHAWYHRYRPSDNPSPPMRNDGVGWECQAEGCAACALAQSRG